MRSDHEGLLSHKYDNQTWMIHADMYSICFQNVAKNPVNICYKQLGLEQQDLKSLREMTNELKTHKTNKSKDKNWRNTEQFFTEYNVRWRKRNEFLIKKRLFLMDR